MLWQDLTEQVSRDTQEYRDGLGTRLSQVIERFETKSLAAGAAGVSVEQLNKWIKGLVKVPAEALRAISSPVGIDFSWLVTGEGEPFAPSRTLTFAEQALVSGGNDFRKMMAVQAGIPEHMIPNPHERIIRNQMQSTRAEIAPPGFAFLPFYEEVLAAAGAGSAVVNDASHSVIGFDRQFLLDSGGSPQHSTVIRARGDSMTPTIPDGSLLVVDHSQTGISNGCIMVIGVGEDILVKRVRRRLDGLIDLISDNSAYAPETLGPEALQQLRVIGRVVYFCRTP